jgi:hypothetical protein
MTSERVWPWGKITGVFVLLGFTTLGARHAVELKAVVHGDCPFLAGVIPKLAPLVKRVEEKFPNFADCDALASDVGRMNVSIYVDGSPMCANGLRKACEKWKFTDAELRHVFTGTEEVSDVLVHGFGYGVCPKSGKRIRKHVVAEAVKTTGRPDKGIHISIGKTCSPTSHEDASGKGAEDPVGASMVAALEQHLASGDCDKFLSHFAEDATHQTLASHGRGPSVIHGKDAITEHCEHTAAKMRDIVRLNYDQPLAVLSQHAEDGLTTTTMILEKSKKVKFSPKIVTSAVAWVIGHRNNKIEHSTQYELDAKHLVDKYGFKYGAESGGFLDAGWKKQRERGEERWHSSERHRDTEPTHESPSKPAPAVAQPPTASTSETVAASPAPSTPSAPADGEQFSAERETRSGSFAPPAAPLAERTTREYEAEAVPALPSGGDFAEYNCFTRERWSPAKTEWCCQHRALGCLSPAAAEAEPSDAEAEEAVTLVEAEVEAETEGEDEAEAGAGTAVTAAASITVSMQEQRVSFYAAAETVVLASAEEEDSP